VLLAATSLSATDDYDNGHDNGRPITDRPVQRQTMTTTAGPAASVAGETETETIGSGYTAVETTYSPKSKRTNTVSSNWARPASRVVGR